MCVEGGGKREEEEDSIMAFPAIRACLDSSLVFFCAPWPHQLSSITIQLPSNIYFFSPKSPVSLRLSDSVLSFCFILPPPLTTPSVYQKFTLPDSTNPVERPEERKCSRTCTSVLIHSRAADSHSKWCSKHCKTSFLTFTCFKFCPWWDERICIKPLTWALNPDYGTFSELHPLWLKVIYI